MKSYTKILIVLLVLSLFWIYTTLDLTYHSFVIDETSNLLMRNYSVQLKFVYFFGFLINISYFALIFLKRSNELEE
jgi:uncharacterized membrane protein SpoIIM required for sporulation